MKTAIKSIIFSIILFLMSLSTYAVNTRPEEPQRGNTCLFTCMNHLQPSKSVDDFIADFNSFLGTNQDGYTSGAKATLQQNSDFINSEFKTKDLREVGLMPALDSGYNVLTCLKLYDENGVPTYHEIVLTGYVPNENYKKIKLKFYDPQTGNIELMKMMNYVNYNPPYALIILK